MTTKELMAIVKARGLELRLKDGQPVLHYKAKAEATDRLLAVLKFHRDRIIEHLRREAKHDA